MALLETPVREHGFYAADFSLRGIDGQIYNLESCQGKKGLVVMFICNHCPYVKAIIDRMVDDCRFLQENGVGCVAIMPNDSDAYPADSFENMKIFAEENDFSFPYLVDETQEVARTYGAVCTPDIYGFDAQGMLQYRGRLDSAGPKEADSDTKRELRNAMMAIAEGVVGKGAQHPSMGCSIKWRE